jgi:RND family efflux transporter MFP subunit
MDIMKLPEIFKKRWFLLLVVVALIIGAYFYRQSQTNRHKQPETYSIQARDLQEVVTASGKITAKNQATLRFQAAGQLAWVGVKKGDSVQAGQAIASLDQRRLQKDLEKYLSLYMTSRMGFDETTKETYKDQSLTDSIQRILNQTQYSLDRSVIDVEIANLAKQYATLVSPINGIVTQATDEYPGINTSLTGTQYTIVDPSSLQFSAEVEETDIGKIREQTSAIVNLDAFPMEDLATIVSDIEFTSTTNTSGNTVYVVSLPISQDSRYRLDMNGDAQIIISKKYSVVAVPIDYVEETEDKKFVTLLKNNQIQKQEITTGLETDDYYEVLIGLSLNDKIVISQ